MCNKEEMKMKLIDHINIYFGTEFESVQEFIKDIRKGDLSQDYDNAEDKLTNVLMFLNALDINN